MLEVKNLTRYFGDLCAVSDLSFKVGEGEVLGFLGPNGAGKSTTMRMISGFLNPHRGTAIVAGHDILKEPLLAKAKLGYLPEGAPTYGDMTPAQFLNFIADVRGLSAHKKNQRINEVVEQLELDDVWLQPIDTLSKGYKRRVGLAQAILHDPEVLLLDEPTDGLDPNQKHQVRELIKSIAERKTIIISTHILEEVDAVCTRAVIIAQGHCVADGTPAELEAQSRYHEAISLRFKQKPALLTDLLQIRGVADIEYNGDYCTLIPITGGDIAVDVLSYIQAQGWPLIEYYVERGRLDEVFHRLTVKGQN